MNIFFVHSVTNKILSRDSNYIAAVVMRPKFGNSSFSDLEILHQCCRSAKTETESFGR